MSTTRQRLDPTVSKFEARKYRIAVSSVFVRVHTHDYCLPPLEELLRLSTQSMPMWKELGAAPSDYRRF